MNKRQQENKQTPLYTDSNTMPVDSADFQEFNDIHTVYTKQQAEEKITVKKPPAKTFKIFGWICIAITLLTILVMPNTTVDTSEMAQRALDNSYSTELAIGTRLLADDEPMSARDIDIVHSYHNEETNIWIWDFAAEDGDYVQIIVNGMPLGDAFMIRHRPIQLRVPAVGSIQVRGVRDGVGGITYAIHFGLNGTTYFNSAPVGGYNTFTLIRQ